MQKMNNHSVEEGFRRSLTAEDICTRDIIASLTIQNMKSFVLFYTPGENHTKSTK